MKIIDVLNKVHNVGYLMISKHNNPNNPDSDVVFKIFSIEEGLLLKEYQYEFDWFEMTIHMGKVCIEFNL